MLRQLTSIVVVYGSIKSLKTEVDGFGFVVMTASSILTRLVGTLKFTEMAMNLHPTLQTVKGCYGLQPGAED